MKKQTFKCMLRGDFVKDLYDNKVSYSEMWTALERLSTGIKRGEVMMCEIKRIAFTLPGFATTGKKLTFLYTCDEREYPEIMIGYDEAYVREGVGYGRGVYMPHIIQLCEDAVFADIYQDYEKQEITFKINETFSKKERDIL